MIKILNLVWLSRYSGINIVPIKYSKLNSYSPNNTLWPFQNQDESFIYVWRNIV